MRQGRKSVGLSGLLPPRLISQIESSGSDRVKELGTSTIREVVSRIMHGENVRDSTEFITRRRITELNLSLLEFYIKLAHASPDIVQNLPKEALALLSAGTGGKTVRWVAQWLLGLTDKGFQNILRDDSDALHNYMDQYSSACREVALGRDTSNGSIRGNLCLATGERCEVNLTFLSYLLNTIGAETLTIRGSDKSAYGKLFERLVLASLLHMLGFRQVSRQDTSESRGVFWLSSREDRRESDATLLIDSGKGVRFDIGFIGRGNTELSLDKVSRFEQELVRGRQTWYMATFIIVDRIGAGSRIEELAKRIEGTIVQMSMGLWPKQVAEQLFVRTRYDHPLRRMDEQSASRFIKERLCAVPFDQLIGLDS